MVENKLPSRQVMFNRAYRGLASQGWLPAVVVVVRGDAEVTVSCNYHTYDGKRCAWGWVDPEGTAKVEWGDVTALDLAHIGLAQWLTQEDLAFARRLQATHDNVGIDKSKRNDPKALKFAMVAFAEREGLTVPPEV